MTRSKVVDGMRLPDRPVLTENELAWVSFLRAIAPGEDPAPTLRGVQALRVALTIGRSEFQCHPPLNI